MKKQLKMTLYIVTWIALIGVVGSGVCLADVYWETITETIGAPALPKGLPKQVLEQIKAQQGTNEPELSKVWLSANAMRMESPKGVMIIRYDEMAMYWFEPGKNVCQKSDMREMSQMMGSMGMAAPKIQPTKETKKIGNFECIKYIETSDMGQAVFWVSNKFDAYDEYQAVTEAIKKFYDKEPALKQMNIGNTMGVIEGFPIQTSREVMGVKTTTTVKTIKAEKHDSSRYTVPAGYTIQKAPIMQMLNQTK